MLESVGTGALVTALVTMGGLFVRSLVSGSAQTAARYEAELERQRAAAARREAELTAQLEWWRQYALTGQPPS